MTELISSPKNRNINFISSHIGGKNDDTQTDFKEQLKIINDKYAKEAQDKLDEIALKEKEAAEERLHEKQLELIELQSIIDAADEGNFQAGLSKQEQELMASQDYYFQLKEQALAAGLDATALLEAITEASQDPQFNIFEFVQAY